MIWARVEFGAKIGVFSRENGRFGNTLIMENIEDTPSYCDIFKDNPQVELPGFVTEEEMGNICNSADVLLSVRNPNHPDNILNYPSKLPHYLSFGRPIVSTRLQSLSPDYGEVVNFPKQDTVDSYVTKLEEVLGWEMRQREAEYCKIKAWFESRKSWDTMVAGLVKWIKK